MEELDRALLGLLEDCSEPAGVTVTDALCATGAEAASATLTQALKDAHMKSGTYAQEKMAGLYSEMGLTQGMAGMQ